MKEKFKEKNDGNEKKNTSTNSRIIMQMMQQFQQKQQKFEDYTTSLNDRFS